MPTRPPRLGPLNRRSSVSPALLSLLSLLSLLLLPSLFLLAPAAASPAPFQPQKNLQRQQQQQQHQAPHPVALARQLNGGPPTAQQCDTWPTDDAHRWQSATACAAGRTSVVCCQLYDTLHNRRLYLASGCPSLPKPPADFLRLFNAHCTNGGSAGHDVDVADADGIDNGNGNGNDEKKPDLKPRPIRKPGNNNNNNGRPLKSGVEDIGPLRNMSTHTGAGCHNGNCNNCNNGNCNNNNNCHNGNCNSGCTSGNCVGGHGGGGCRWIKCRTCKSGSCTFCTGEQCGHETRPGCHNGSCNQPTCNGDACGGSGGCHGNACGTTCENNQCGRCSCTWCNSSGCGGCTCGVNNGNNNNNNGNNGNNNNNGNGGGGGGGGGGNNNNNNNNNNSDDNQNGRPVQRDDGSVCLHGDNEVALEDGSRKAVRDLRVNDVVAVGGGAFSRVFMFTHQDASLRAWFVDLTVSSPGRKNETLTMTVTPSHFVHLAGSTAGVVAAGQVRVGDQLVVGDAERTPASVVRVERRRDAGVFNPQTEHGDIVVGGLLATTFTTFTPGRQCGHAMLMPLRALFKATGVHVSAMF